MLFIVNHKNAQQKLIMLHALRLSNEAAKEWYSSLPIHTCTVDKTLVYDRTVLYHRYIHLYGAARAFPIPV